MNGPDATPSSGLAPLIDALASQLGVTPQVALGTPVVLALRCEARPDGLFLSGVPAEMVDLIAARFGAVVERSQPDGVRLVPTATADLSKLDQAGRMRDDLRAAGERLRSELDALPTDLPMLMAAADPRALSGALADVAHSRHLNGRYLVDAGDWFDDERIDQLGDGYNRAAALWQGLATEYDEARLDEVLALERTCAGWMTSAAEPPTRYAF